MRRIRLHVVRPPSSILPRSFPAWIQALAFVLFGVIQATYGATQPAAAQPANHVLFEEVVVECLDKLPPSVDRLVLNTPEHMPYVRSALVAAWSNDGKEIFLPGATDVGALVEVGIEEARVTYTRRRRRLAREIRLTLRYTVTNDEKRLLADGRCTRSRSDLITRAQIASVESEAWPETQGNPPPRGFFRRIVEPVVLTGATAVAAYLFFTLRSTGDSDS